MTMLVVVGRSLVQETVTSTKTSADLAADFVSALLPTIVREGRRLRPAETPSGPRHVILPTRAARVAQLIPAAVRISRSLSGTIPRP